MTLAQHFRRGCALVTLPLLLAACGGGSGSNDSDSGGAQTAPPPADNVSITGTVAIGAPASNAHVAVKCRSGYTTSGSTDANGGYTLSAPADALPCALQATGGNLPDGLALHSLANADGTTNITPLTDLIMAFGTRQTPSAWFDNAPTGLDDADTAVQEATGDVVALLRDKGFTLPEADFNPLTSPFSPQAGDPYDDFLEALRTALDKTDDSYQSLLDALIAGELDKLPSHGSDIDPEAPSHFTLVVAHQGTYAVTGTEPSWAPDDWEWSQVHIQANGVIVFDGTPALSLAPDQRTQVYDRLYLSGDDKRIHINYDPAKGDGGLGLRLIVDDNGQIVKIRYLDGEGHTSTLLVQKS